jgi:peptidoglycan/xylan/chitin deacetylase (PgdA/CDA1 family)
MKNGCFVISLDFELYWGVRDTRTLDTYGKNILGVREAIPAMLELFERYKIKATFATVGFLFCNSKEELLQYIPGQLPSYKNKELSPYEVIPRLGADENSDPYHFGASLIKQILQHKEHEIATHTFSHYYCLETGQTTEQFRSDLRAAKLIAMPLGIRLKSIVFPRNQYNNEYLRICREEGISSFRGNENSILYTPTSREKESSLRRLFRFADSYINLTGHHVYDTSFIAGISNVPSSRFLRPYNKSVAWFDRLKFRRIRKQMDAAARQGKIFHLWWHPHNFGANLKENMAMLEKILEHYKTLNRMKGFRTMTMTEAAAEI